MTAPEIIALIEKRLAETKQAIHVFSSTIPASQFGGEAGKTLAIAKVQAQSEELEYLLEEIQKVY